MSDFQHGETVVQQIQRLTAERDALVHDIGRHLTICTELLTENKALEAERDKLRAICQRIEPYIDSIIDYSATVGECDGNAIAAELRAALEQAQFPKDAT